MSAQKLIEKLESKLIDTREGRNTLTNQGFNIGIEEAIDLIKSNDFGEGDEKLRKVREEIKIGDAGELFPIQEDTFLSGYNVQKSRCLNIIDSHLAPQPSEEVLDILREMDRIKTDNTSSLSIETRKSIIWVLEQRFKEAKNKGDK